MDLALDMNPPPTTSPSSDAMQGGHLQHTQLKRRGRLANFNGRARLDCKQMRCRERMHVLEHLRHVEVGPGAAAADVHGRVLLLQPQRRAVQRAPRHQRRLARPRREAGRRQARVAAGRAQPAVRCPGTEHVRQLARLWPRSMASAQPATLAARRAPFAVLLHNELTPVRCPASHTLHNHWQVLAKVLAIISATTSCRGHGGISGRPRMVDHAWPGVHG